MSPSPLTYQDEYFQYDIVLPSKMSTFSEAYYAQVSIDIGIPSLRSINALPCTPFVSISLRKDGYFDASVFESRDHLREMLYELIASILKRLFVEHKQRHGESFLAQHWNAIEYWSLEEYFELSAYFPPAVVFKRVNLPFVSTAQLAPFKEQPIPSSDLASSELTLIPCLGMELLNPLSDQAAYVFSKQGNVAEVMTSSLDADSELHDYVASPLVCVRYPSLKRYRGKRKDPLTLPIYFVDYYDIVHVSSKNTLNGLTCPIITKIEGQISILIPFGARDFSFITHCLSHHHNLKEKDVDAYLQEILSSQQEIRQRFQVVK